MTQLLSPGTTIIEEAPQLVLPAQSPTAVTGIACVTQRGPIEATRVTSKDAWVNLYGLITADAQYGPLFVDRFFNAGGRELWTKRVVHYTDIDNPATQQGAQAEVSLDTAASAASPAQVDGTIAGPWAITSGLVLTADVEGGGTQDLTFTHSPASKTSATGGTYNIPDLSTLVIPINGDDKNIIFDASFFVDNTQARADEVAAFLNQYPGFTGVNVTRVGDAATGTVKIDTDGSGTDFSIGVITGTAASLFSFPGGVVTGGGNVGNGNAVTQAELKSLAEATFTNGSGVNVTTWGASQPRIETVQTGNAATLAITGTAAAVFGFPAGLFTGSDGAPAPTLTVKGKWIGTYANDLEIQIAAPTSGNSGEFNLIVLENDVIRETWANLVIGVANELATNYVEAVINGLGANVGSNLIEVVDLELGAADSTPAVGTFALIGGDDGLTGLADTDFIGSAVTASGLRGFDQALDLRILAVPEGATPAIHQAMLTYCEITRKGTIFAILDPPANQTAAQIKTYVETTAALLEASEFAAIFWPRLKIINPRKDIFGNVETITVPPSGIICGVIARTDAARIGGVYDPPAGVERGILTGAAGFETDEVQEEGARDLIFPVRINPLRTEPGQPRYIDGPLTLKSTGPFPTIAERRGVIVIEDLVDRATKFIKHSNINAGLLARANRTVTAVLTIEMNKGAFASTDPALAFKVDTGPGINTPLTRQAGQVWIRIGLATNKPALFIIILVSQDTLALDAAAAGAS